MEKDELVTKISILLNKPSFQENDAQHFEDKKHDDSVEDLRQYLSKNSAFLGNPQIEFLQGLNDHGVDLILKTHDNIKIGFQIKSHHDVSEKNFAAKVKAQIVESLFHGIHKLYLLICSPYSSKKTNYKPRISHLLSELSSYKTTYFCYYSPVSSVGLFLDNNKMENELFYSIYKQFTMEMPNTEDIIREISPKELQTGFLNRLNVRESNDIDKASSFIEYLLKKGFDVNSTELLQELKIYCTNLKLIPQISREFFISVLFYAESYGILGNNINCVYSPYIDVKDSLELPQDEMLIRIKNLKNKNLLNIDEDDSYEDGQIVIQVTSSTIHDDLCLSFEIREYFENNIERLKSFFIYFNFKELE